MWWIDLIWIYATSHWCLYLLISTCALASKCRAAILLFIVIFLCWPMGVLVCQYILFPLNFIWIQRQRFRPVTLGFNWWGLWFEGHYINIWNSFKSRCEKFIILLRNTWKLCLRPLILLSLLSLLAWRFIVFNILRLCYDIIIVLYDHILRLFRI